MKSVIFFFVILFSLSFMFGCGGTDGVNALLPAECSEVVWVEGEPTRLPETVETTMGSVQVMPRTLYTCGNDVQLTTIVVGISNDSRRADGQLASIRLIFGGDTYEPANRQDRYAKFHLDRPLPTSPQEFSFEYEVRGNRSPYVHFSVSRLVYKVDGQPEQLDNLTDLQERIILAENGEYRYCQEGHSAFGGFDPLFRQPSDTERYQLFPLIFVSCLPEGVPFPSVDIDMQVAAANNLFGNVVISTPDGNEKPLQFVPSAENRAHLSIRLPDEYIPAGISLWRVWGQPQVEVFTPPLFSWIVDYPNQDFAVWLTAYETR